MAQTSEKATFAGGCFWCMVKPFDHYDGVKEVVSGYTGGTLKNPTYKQVSSGKTQHLEAVQITFDPTVISYQELLDIFWKQIDPTDAGGSFADRGQHYTSAIFTHNEEQDKLANTSKAALEKDGPFSKPIVTAIHPATDFYPAEDYHQDYYKKNPIRYKAYRFGSGRDHFLKTVWKKPKKDDLKSKLTPLQYHVTQEDGTEKPFQNEYWDNKRPGIYVDVITGEPLFVSTDKYDSGSGWPSFTKPISDDVVVTKKDYKLLMPRLEVRSKTSDAHLGHVFNDGPASTGKRYCMNSAALTFIPKDQMKEKGYADYLNLVQ